MKISHSLNILLSVLQLFVGITAILGGFGLVSDPSGAGMEVPLTLLENSLFANYLIPGLVLLIVIGVGNVLGGIVTFFRHRHFGNTAVFLGGFLVLYVLIEIGIIGLLNFSQPLYFLLGGVEIILGLKLPRLVKTDGQLWVETTAEVNC
jgi:hypothetical protein